MNLQDIKERAELSRKAIQQMKVQEKVLDDVFLEAMKNAPEDQKEGINKVRNLMQEVKRLTSEGKLNEANDLLTNFDYVGKNSK